MDKERIYISGKMRHLAEAESRRIFAEAQHKLEAQGYEAINPWLLADAKMDAGCKEWGDFIMFDLAVLKTCDAIYMLPNWTDSLGANIEINYAKGNGIKIIYEQEVVFLENLKSQLETNEDIVCFGCFYDRKNKKYFAMQKGDDSVIERMLRHTISTKNAFKSMLVNVLDLLSARHARPKKVMPFQDFMEIFDNLKK